VDVLKNELVLKERFDHEDQHSFIDLAQSGIKASDEDKIAEVCRAYEHRIAALEAHIQEMQIPHDIAPPLTSASSIAIRSVSSMSSSGTVTPVSSPCSSRRTPTPTKKFLQSIGIEASSSVNSSSYTLPVSLAGSLSDKQLSALLGLNDEGFVEVGSPTLEEFAKEEDKRIEQLESRIDHHINEMKQAMDQAMEKYLKKS